MSDYGYYMAKAHIYGTRNKEYCNPLTNAVDAANDVRKTKNKASVAQIKEAERLNVILAENNMELIPIIENPSRGYLRTMILSKIKQLSEKGIDFSNPNITTRCGNCEHFRQGIGQSGFCKYHRFNTKVDRACHGGSL